jgi:sodium/potassium-transporting ATPase subunit alpha
MASLASKDYDLHGRTDSYRVATVPSQFDDNKTVDGKPKTRRKAPSSISTKYSHAENLDELKQDPYLDYHKVPLDELYQRFGTHPGTGLTHAKARENLERDGPNTLTPPMTTPEWIKFAKQIFGGFSVLLWCGALLCFLAHTAETSTTEDPNDDYVSF